MIELNLCLSCVVEETFGLVNGKEQWVITPVYQYTQTHTHRTFSIYFMCVGFRIPVLLPYNTILLRIMRAYDKKGKFSGLLKNVQTEEDVQFSEKNLLWYR